jgi:hypothetical protein
VTVSGVLVNLLMSDARVERLVSRAHTLPAAFARLSEQLMTQLSTLDVRWCCCVDVYL